MKLLREALEREKINFTDNTIQTFYEYRDLVLAWNEKVNLTAIKDKDEFEVRHFVDSVVGAGFYNKEDIRTIIDVGTGAGFPGMPLAIIFPDKQFVLLDSLAKRINIINEMAKTLGITNVIAIHGRAEEIARDKKHREKYDICISRAVAKLSILAEYCVPFVKKGGYFAPYKSTTIEDELTEAKKAFSMLGVKLESRSEHEIGTYSSDEIIKHQILYLKKTMSTPSIYPRKAGTPEKKPL